jgi:glycosyltransferase involved in cell wall biosynthesis
VTNKSAIPKISVISFCLNSGKYLRETIGSVLNQSCIDYEFIIKDGGSTDGTIDILKEYPQIRWISEKENGDNPTMEALWQAFGMSTGEYIVFLAVSDNISDPQWFRKASAVLDSDTEVSWVWGLKQTKSENGHLGKITYQEYLQNPPPQKMAWLPFWFALQHAEETNAIFRRSLFEKYFPKNNPDDPYRYNASLGFNLRLNMMGHSPFFLPIISFYGYTHENQLQQRYQERLDSLAAMYRRDVVTYRKKFLSGKITHKFRDGFSNVIHEVGKDELRNYRKKVLTYRIKYKLRRELQKMMEHIVY